MWPHKDTSFVVLPEDADGKHFGLFVGDKLVSVISLFTTGKECQFRKFATLDDEQGKGYGSQLFSFLIDFVKNMECDVLWCNARFDKRSFYEKYGMKTSGETFMKEGITYIRMELLL